MFRSRRSLAGLVSLCLGALGACGNPIDEAPPSGATAATLPPQGNGDVGALSFSRTVFGVDLDGEVLISRPVAVACGPGCSRVETRAITSAIATADPPLVGLSVAEVQYDGAVRVRLRGAAPGTTKLWIDAIVDGQIVRDTIDLRVLRPESFSLGCALGGFSVAQGLLVGAKATCELEAIAEGTTLGTLVPQAQGGLAVEALEAPGVGFRLTATTSGRAALVAAVGGRSFAQPIDVVAEAEVMDVRVFDVEAMRVRTGPLQLAAGRSLPLRPQVVTADGRVALGFEDRVSAGPSQILRLQLGTNRFVLSALGAGAGTLSADIAGRRWDIPVVVQ